MSITEPLTSDHENDSRDQQTQDGMRKHSSQDLAESDGKFVSALLNIFYFFNFHQMTPKMSKLKCVTVMMILSRHREEVLLMHQVVSQATLLQHLLVQKALCLLLTGMNKGWTRVLAKQKIKNQVTLDLAAYQQLMSWLVYFRIKRKM